MKHNKKRNTAFIYEAIIRELAKAIHENNEIKKKTIIKLIRESFSSTTLMGKDLDLYKSILETKDVDKYTAEKIVFQSRIQKNALNHKKLFVEQSEFIETINKNISPDVFSNFVPNFKDLATIFQIFHPKTKTKNRVLLESQVIEKMISGTQQKQSDLKPIDNLTYKTFVNKFNEKYTSALIKEQKELLSKFIGSFSDNGVELKIYLNEEIPRLFRIISESKNSPEIKSDLEMLNKTNRVIEILKKFDQRPFDKEMIHDVLSIQRLAMELD